MADIFLSYARADQARIEALAASLERAGYTLWWDKHIKGGKAFGKDIETAIKEAKAVIVAWSASSTESHWVLDEASYARDSGKIVPIRLDNAEIPFGYRQVQALDLSGGITDSNLADLTAAVDEIIGGENHVAHAPPGPPAPGKRALIAILAILVALSGVGSWWFVTQRSDSQEGADTAPLSERQSLAVLPFVASSGGEDDQYLADGLTEEILNQLDALGELMVAPRTSSFSFRDKDLPINEIATQLAVDHVLEGSLRHQGDKVRVTARLVRAADGTPLWSNNYEATLDDVFEVQTEIAQQVATALDVLLDDAKRARMKEVGVDNPEAFARFAKAMDGYFNAHSNLSGNMQQLREATEDFEAIFEAEPFLWEAPYTASDYYSHIVLDSAYGDERYGNGNIDSESALRRYNQLLLAARNAARDHADKAIVEHSRLMFANDWSNVVANAETFMSDDGGCAMPTFTNFLIGFGRDRELLDYNMGRERCVTDPRIVSINMMPVAVYTGQEDRVLKVLEQREARGLAHPGAADQLYLLKALREGRRNDALSIVDRTTDGVERTFSEAIITGDRSLISESMMAKLEEARKSARLHQYALLGLRQKANALAAQIDTQPGGPAALHLVYWDCYCGAPWDLSATPKYAAALKTAGIDRLPPSPIKWPLKDW